MDEPLPELFTLISLMIGLFGATVTAVIFIKAFGEKKVVEYLDEAKEKTLEMEKTGSSEESLLKLDGYRKGIEHCRIGFAAVTITPVALFAIWVFSTCIYVSLSEECEQLFAVSRKFDQPFVGADPNKERTTKDGSAASAGHILKNAITECLRRRIFGRTTCTATTIIDLACILLGFLCLGQSWRRHKDITKLHETVIAERIPRLKKTPTDSSTPKQQGKKPKSTGEEPL